jgi:ATP-binding cassette, subfamily B (MDR/TAP), member 7
MNVLRSSRSWRGLHLYTASRACRPQTRLPRFEPQRLSLRLFQHLASNTDKDAPKSTPETAPKVAAKSAPAEPTSTLADEGHISIAQQRKNDWQIIKRLSRELWPKDDWSTKGRVILGVGLLVAGKVKYYGYASRVSATAEVWARS